MHRLLPHQGLCLLLSGGGVHKLTDAVLQLQPTPNHSAQVLLGSGHRQRGRVQLLIGQPGVGIRSSLSADGGVDVQARIQDLDVAGVLDVLEPGCGWVRRRGGIIVVSTRQCGYALEWRGFAECFRRWLIRYQTCLPQAGRRVDWV